MKSSHGHDYVLDLSEEAKSDLKDIQKHTFITYGEDPVYKYQVVLDKSFQTVLDNPALGHSRSDIPPLYKAYQAGQHIIICRVEESKIYVVRVLHGSMNFTDKFSA